MKKALKKILCAVVATTVAAGACSLAACSTPFKPVANDEAKTVTSNGGFVVATETYYYFINGVETYTAANEYGNVVKGALMRIKKDDAKKNETAETVVPSLMAAGDYDAGIYIYDGRIYYATPNDVKNTAGEIEKDYLWFRTAKTDGSDVKDLFRVSENAAQYRFVEVDGTVYVLYIAENNLHSFNTKTKKDTVLVKGGTYKFNKEDKTDPYVYYTMSVADGQDTDNARSFDYNQVYRVRADWTESFYEYTWDQEYLDEHDGEAPYLNLGELVLDGIGATDMPATQFNHDVKDDVALPAIGYTYTLQTVENGGVYFTRKLVSTPGTTVGSTGELYYLPFTAIDDANWNTITGNNSESLDVVANAVNASNASDKAIFYIDETDEYKHHYLYVDGEYIYRADVKKNGNGATADDGDVQIAYDVEGATLVSRAESEGYGYLYFTCSGTSGNNVMRAVYTGTYEDYRNLQGDSDKELYESVRILKLEHAKSWYNFEILDDTLFYANAEAFSSTSYNYVYTMDLANTSGKLMNNKEIRALNKKYDEVMGTDGYVDEVATDVSTNASTAIKYYFYTGERAQFDENIRFSMEEGGKKDTFLYTEKDKTAFNDFVEEKVKDGDKVRFRDENGKSYRVLSYFTNMIGEKNKADEESYAEYWKTTLQNYKLPEKEDEGLAWWAWMLIGISIGVVVAGIILAIVLILRKKKKANAQEEKQEKMKVDTQDDREIDVYADHSEAVDQAAADEKEEPAEEVTDEPQDKAPVEEEAPADEKEAPEQPAEEPVKEETPEAPAEEPAEQAEPKAEEPAKEEAPEAPAEESFKEETPGVPAEEPAKEETSEAPTEEPAEPVAPKAEEPAETPAEEDKPEE